LPKERKEGRKERRKEGRKEEKKEEEKEREWHKTLKHLESLDSIHLHFSGCSWEA
jgi:hypothetical protein